MPTRTAERLAVYGLQEPPRGEVRNLRLRRRRRLDLSHRNPPAGVRLELARPRTLEDVKRMVGTPDDALRRPARPTPFDLRPVTRRNFSRLTREQRVAYQSAIQTFVYQHSATLTEDDLKIILALYELMLVEIVIPVYICEDIVVASGATLSVEAGSVLFANNITVEAGGVIAAGNYCTIDCNSFTGL